MPDPRFVVYDKDPGCFQDLVTLQVYHVDHFPSRNQIADECELGDLVPWIVAALNAMGSVRDIVARLVRLGAVDRRLALEELADQAPHLASEVASHLQISLLTAKHVGLPRQPTAPTPAPPDDGWTASPSACPHCGQAGQLYFRAIASSDHDDQRIQCRACGRTWCVDGDDG